MKKYFALFLILAACGDLEKGTLRDWGRASDKSRDRVIAAHFADNADYIKRCITRTATLPNTEKMAVLKVGELCRTSLLARENAATKPKAAAPAQKLKKKTKS
ncbi:MAG: hypothetical protein LBL46_03560 [Rickettsiales bacterium]|jgi:hypothetical protein|nr:hypothetical protein [Rickettsiales bacterium]